MLFRQPARFTNLSLLLLRLMVAFAFATSRWRHLKNPEGRSKLGMAAGVESSRRSKTH